MTSSQPTATPVAEGLVARAARALGYVMSGDASWFGPLNPPAPSAPAAVAGRAFDFPSGYNLVARPRAYEGTSFAELRALADAYDLIRLIVETRKDQIERLTWSVRARDRSAAAAKSDPRLAAISALFNQPDGVHPWTTWLRMVLEDLLVIDAPALYLRRTRDGRLCALEPLDGATIKRVIDDWGRTPSPPAPAYQQILKGLPAVDYTSDELLYLPRNPRVHKVYGYSPVEQVQMTVNIALRRQIWQLQYYTEGNIPEALIGVPDTWTPDQIRQFQGYWDSLHEGNTIARRALLDSLATAFGFGLHSVSLRAWRRRPRRRHHCRRRHKARARASELQSLLVLHYENRAGRPSYSATRSTRADSDDL